MLLRLTANFVKALHISQYNHDFVESVIRLCHNLNKAVCVEGVETKEEWEPSAAQCGFSTGLLHIQACGAGGVLPEISHLDL